MVPNDRLDLLEARSIGAGEKVGEVFASKACLDSRGHKFASPHDVPGAVIAPGMRTHSPFADSTEMAAFGAHAVAYAFGTVKAFLNARPSSFVHDRGHWPRMGSPVSSRSMDACHERRLPPSRCPSLGGYDE